MPRPLKTENPRWGSKEYRTVHQRLKDTRGLATDSPCVICGDHTKKHEWAYLHNSWDEQTCPQSGRRYSNRLKDYEAMCPGCHRKFDNKPKWNALSATRSQHPDPWHCIERNAKDETSRVSITSGQAS